MKTAEELKKETEDAAAAVLAAKAEADLEKAKTLTAAANAGDREDPKDAGDKDKRSFSQEQVDALVKSRVARAKKQYADYDALKKKAKAHDQDELSKKSALEQAQAALASLEAERDALLVEGQEIRLRSQVLLAATELKFWSPGDAWGHLVLNELGADAGVEDIKAAVEAIAAAKPYLIQSETDPKKRKKTKALNPDKDQREQIVTDEERGRMYFGALGGGNRQPFFGGGGVRPTSKGKTA